MRLGPGTLTTAGYTNPLKIRDCCRTLRRGKWATAMAVAILYKNFMCFNYVGTASMARWAFLLTPWCNSACCPVLPTTTAAPTLVCPGRIYILLVMIGAVGALCHSGGQGLPGVSHFNASTLQVEETWHISQCKPAVSGTCMAYRVLYALRPLSIGQEESFYAFDTTGSAVSASCWIRCWKHHQALITNLLITGSVSTVMVS